MRIARSENAMQGKIIIEARDLKKWFPVRRSLSEILRRENICVKAVDGVDFTVSKEEILGVVGESGCGKTTIARLMTGVIRPTEGDVYFEGRSVASLKDRVRKIQMIFQDPYEYLSPWSRVKASLLEPLHINKVFNDETENMHRVTEIMEIVGLTPIDEFLPKHHFELSGGERQRVLVARALMLNPEFVVADEPVSMLDASIRAGVLNVILDLKEKYHTSFLFITHDLSVARYMCDHIAVMYLGKIMEKGRTDDVIQKSRHPYTKALVAAVPDIDIRKRRSTIPIKGEVQSARSLPSGCRFHPRCPNASDKCINTEPELMEVSRDHFVRCFFDG